MSDEEADSKMSKEKFSAAHGFEPGVVVEVIFNRNVAHFGPGKPYLFRFKGYSEYEIVILEENNGNELQPYPIEIESIRILSGVFGLWQFAPVKAEFAIVWEYGDVGFETTTGLEFIREGLKDEYGDEIGTEAPKYKIYDRPWWAKQ